VASHAPVRRHVHAISNAVDAIEFSDVEVDDRAAAECAASRDKTTSTPRSESSAVLCIVARCLTAGWRN